MRNCLVGGTMMGKGRNQRSPGCKEQGKEKKSSKKNKTMRRLRELQGKPQEQVSRSQEEKSKKQRIKMCYLLLKNQE